MADDQEHSLATETSTEFLKRQAVNWWPAIHRGTLYAAIAVAVVLEDRMSRYNSLSEIDGLTWIKLTLAAFIAGANAILAFVNQTVGQLRIQNGGSK